MLIHCTPTEVFTYDLFDHFLVQSVYVFTGHERFTSLRMLAAPVRVGQLTPLPITVHLCTQAHFASTAGLPT